MEKSVASRIAKVKAAQTADEKIVARLDSALGITDRLLEHLTSDDGDPCETCGRGNTATVKELLAGQKQITQWVARFAASEAPKRLQVGGTVTHDHVIKMDETVDAIVAFYEHMQGWSLGPLSKPVIEVGTIPKT